MDAIFRRGIDPPCRAPSSLSAVEQLRAPAADSGELEPGYRHGREVRRDVRAPQVAVERDRLGTQARALLDPGCAVFAEQDFARVRIDPVVFDDLGFLAGKPGLSLGLGLEGVVSGADHAVRAGIAASNGPREDGGWRRNGGGGPYRSASCTSARRTSARARSSLAAWNEWTVEGIRPGMRPDALASRRPVSAHTTARPVIRGSPRSPMVSPRGIRSCQGGVSLIVTVVPGLSRWGSPRMVISSGVPSSMREFSSSWVSLIRIWRPQNRSEKASSFQARGSRGVKDRWPSKSRTPPNPKTSDDHPPAAEAMWTPSEALPATLPRSISSAYWKYSRAWRSRPISAAMMLCTHADKDESPVVSGS